MIIYLVRLLTTLPLIFGWKKIRSSLLVFFGLNFTSELISTILLIFKVHTSLKDTFHYNSILLISSIAVISFYSSLYKISNQWFLLISSLYFLFFAGTTLYFFDSFYEFNTYAFSLLHAIVIVFTTIGFYKIFKSEALIFIEKSAFFWLNSAFLIYASGSIIITIFSKYLIERDPELQLFFWTYLFGTVNIVFYSLSAYAFTLKDDEHFPIFRRRKGKQLGN